MRVAVLTLSTSRAGGKRQDQSGSKLADLARRLGADAVEREVLADHREHALPHALALLAANEAAIDLEASALRA